MNEIKDWLATAPKSVFASVKGNEPAIAKRLEDIVRDPVNLNQADYPICGAYAFLHSIAVRQPDVYIKYVLDLIKTGSASIGTLHVDSPGDVQNKNLSVKGAKIDISSWVAMASLRGSENPRGYKSITRMGGKKGPRSWHAGIKGMSSNAEIKSWFEKAGYTIDRWTDNTKWAYLGRSDVDFKTLVDLGKQFGESEVILSVNAGQIDVNNPSQRPKASGADHFVGLASGVTESGGQTFFLVWSWGAVKEMKVATGDVPRVVYGYVVAKPPKVQAAAPPEAEEASREEASAEASKEEASKEEAPKEQAESVV